MSEKRLFRSRENKMICGVCGGIGEFFWSRSDTDPFGVCFVWMYRNRNRCLLCSGSDHSGSPITWFLGVCIKSEFLAILLTEIHFAQRKVKTEKEDAEKWLRQRTLIWNS